MPLGDASRRPRFAFLLSAPRRLVSSPRLFVSGDGEPTGLLACLVMSCLWREAVVAMLCMCVAAAGSIVMPRSSLLLYCFE